MHTKVQQLVYEDQMILFVQGARYPAVTNF